MKITLNKRELAAVLCGLRCYQQIYDECAGDIPEDLLDIHTCGSGELEDGLDLSEIDALCERLNT